MTDAEPHGTLMRSNYTGMVLVKLRYFWVNLNDSVRRYDSELDFSEWTVTHRPEPVTQPSEPQCQHRQHYEVVVKGCDCSGCWGEASTCTHQPSDPSAKQVGTSPEHANETPESWHVTVPIFAVADGTVLSVDGDTVLIELDDGRHLRWLHMNDIAVTAGDRVVRGQQVGTGLG